ncbi:MAG: serine/threonine-protein kinase, partial [Chloroflexi bacterium]|nr:serine/threonine-protein kinase [Chloroflexota bacterium]
MNGKENGRYELNRPITQTNAAEVYLAHDRHQDCVVILKVLKETTSPNSALVQDYQRAWKAATGLTHPYIVKTQALG